MPDPMWTMRTGSLPSKDPAATATELCRVNANEAPRKTGRGRWRVARTSAARAVLSGSSARKMIPNTERNRLNQLIDFLQAPYGPRCRRGETSARRVSGRRSRSPRATEVGDRALFERVASVSIAPCRCGGVNYSPYRITRLSRTRRMCKDSATPGAVMPLPAQCPAGGMPAGAGARSC